VTDPERLTLICALATNMVENIKYGADVNNRPLAHLLKEIAFEMKLELEIDFSLGGE
jgi:hypothetical protein